MPLVMYKDIVYIIECHKIDIVIWYVRYVPKMMKNLVNYLFAYILKVQRNDLPVIYDKTQVFFCTYEWKCYFILEGHKSNSVIYLMMLT